MIYIYREVANISNNEIATILNFRLKDSTWTFRLATFKCKRKDILWMNYFQCTEKVDGYPLDCKYRFKRLRTFVTWNFQSAIHRKNDRNQIDVPWHFPISRCSSILIFLVLFPFINSQPKYQHNKLLTLAFSKYRGWKKSLLRYYISRNYQR